MKTKEEIVANWLPRYTKRSLEDFGEYILLTNFNKYVELFAEIGKEFKRRFAGCEINKILTIEASGIGIACGAAQYFHCPVSFA